MSIVKAITALLFLLCVGCSAAQSETSSTFKDSQGREVAKVKITLAGGLYLNGKKATLDEVKREFDRLKKVNGVVWYYREAPQKPAPVIASDVIKAVTSARLPILLSEKDFQ